MLHYPCFFNYIKLKFYFCLQQKGSQLTGNFSIESKQNNVSSNHTSNPNTLTNKKSIPIMIVNEDAEQLETKAFQKELPGRPSSVSVFNDISHRLYRRVSMAFQGLKRSSNVTNMHKKNQKATKALGIIFLLVYNIPV